MIETAHRCQRIALFRLLHLLNHLHDIRIAYRRPFMQENINYQKLGDSKASEIAMSNFLLFLSNKKFNYNHNNFSAMQWCLRSKLLIFWSCITLHQIHYYWLSTIFEFSAFNDQNSIQAYMYAFKTSAATRNLNIDYNTLYVVLSFYVRFSVLSFC